MAFTAIYPAKRTSDKRGNSSKGGRRSGRRSGRGGRSGRSGRSRS